MKKNTFQFGDKTKLFNIYNMNMLNLWIVTAVSIIAIIIQLYNKELPCPLCLLQRVGVLAIGIGYLLSIIDKPKPFYYNMSNLAAITTIIVAGRQVLLHIVPGSNSYGSAIWGIHLYSWVVVLCAMLLIWNLLIICLINNDSTVRNKINLHTKIAIVFYTMTIITNIISTYLECGFTQCPDNPVSYMMLKH